MRFKCQLDEVAAQRPALGDEPVEEMLSLLLDAQRRGWPIPRMQFIDHQEAFYAIFESDGVLVFFYVQPGYHNALGLCDIVTDVSGQKVESVVDFFQWFLPNHLHPVMLDRTGAFLRSGESTPVDLETV